MEITVYIRLRICTVCQFWIS